MSFKWWQNRSRRENERRRRSIEAQSLSKSKEASELCACVCWLKRRNFSLVAFGAKCDANDSSLDWRWLSDMSKVRILSHLEAYTHNELRLRTRSVWVKICKDLLAFGANLNWTRGGKVEVDVDVEFQVECKWESERERERNKAWMHNQVD